MEEQNKYFTPDIEDLHIGWEGEVVLYNDDDIKGQRFTITERNIRYVESIL